MKLGNQTAVVYAGARGIGKAYCEILLKKGCKVCFGDISEKEAHEAVDAFRLKYGDDKVIYQQCDVQKDLDVESLLDKAASVFGSVDIVVANAGISNEKDWFKTMDINSGGVIRAFNACLKHMSVHKGGKGGVFIATASMSGLRPSMVPAPVYAASKHAVVGFIRAWGDVENTRLTGIRTGAICPSKVDTSFVSALPPEGIAIEEQRDKWIPIITGTQKKDLLSVDDVASALVQILEDDSSSGKCLMVTKQVGTKYAEYQQYPDS